MRSVNPYNANIYLNSILVFIIIFFFYLDVVGYGTFGYFKPFGFVTMYCLFGHLTGCEDRLTRNVPYEL